MPHLLSFTVLIERKEEKREGREGGRDEGRNGGRMDERKRITARVVSHASGLERLAWQRGPRQNIHQDPLKKPRLWCQIVNYKWGRGKFIHITSRCANNLYFISFTIAAVILRAHILLSNRGHCIVFNLLDTTEVTISQSAVSQMPLLHAPLQVGLLRYREGAFGDLWWMRWEESLEVTWGSVYCLLASLDSRVTFLPTWLFLTPLASSAGDRLVSCLLAEAGHCGLLCFQGPTLALLVMMTWVTRRNAESGRALGYLLIQSIDRVHSPNCAKPNRPQTLSGPREHCLPTIPPYHISFQVYRFEGEGNDENYSS